MVHIAFDLHEGALASVRQDPETFTRELRIAAAVKWYELRRSLFPRRWRTKYGPDLNAIPRVARWKMASERPSTRQPSIPKFSAGAWAPVNRLFCRLPGPRAPSPFSTTRTRESPRARRAEPGGVPGRTLSSQGARHSGHAGGTEKGNRRCLVNAGSLTRHR